MGREKAFLTVGRRELFQRSLDATGEFTDTVVVGGDPAALGRALARYGFEEREGAFLRGDRRVRLVPDEAPRRGPLAGLAAGLGAAAEPLCWVLAIDLPFAVPAIGSILIGELAAAGGGSAEAPDGGAPAGTPAAVVPEIEGRLQPLCAAYEAEAGRLAAEALRRADADASVHGLIARLRVTRLSARRFEDLGDPRIRFLNVNDPEVLARARRIAAAGT